MTATQLLVRRCGLLADIGVDGPVSALPPQIVAQLAPALTYKHQRFLRGAEQYGADGVRRRIEITTRRLYDLSPDGRLQTGFGFIPKLAGLLKAAGYSLRFLDISPPRKRPKCYEPDWDRLHRGNFQWRPRQLECVQRVAEAYGGIIDSPPAFGKTEMIGQLAVLYPHARIAVVTQSRDVAQTIHRRLSGRLPNIGFVGDGKRRIERITVYVAKSLHKADPETDFVFADEAHQLGSDGHAERLFRTFVNARCFGFTATPEGRSDGTDIRLEYIFGPVLFQMGWQEATALGLIVPVVVRWINIQMDHNPAADYSQDVARKRHAIWCNTERNAAIAAAANSHGPDEQTLILVETLEHAVHLGRFLPDFTLCYDGNSMDADRLAQFQRDGLLPNDYQVITPKRREELRRAFEGHSLKKAIATDVWSTGVSFEQLAVLIRADARSSEIMDDQAPGRVVRTHADSGKTSALIYDCWDMFDTSYKRKSQERWRRYAKKGWLQERRRVLEEAT